MNTPAAAVATEQPIINLRGIGRRYETGGGTVYALRDVDLCIYAGEMVAIVGSSGSGKSTLMNVLGGLDRPDEGSYLIDGVDVASLSPNELAALRRERFGFIFQRYHLLAQQDAQANVEMPSIYAGRDAASRRARATALLARLGLTDRAHHKPNALSGGQQQRVSIARALMNGGELILADEPTGALDSHSGAEMMSVLHELHAAGHTVILVTHDPGVAAHAPRHIEMRDGRVIRDTGWPADYARQRFLDAPTPARTGRLVGLAAPLAQLKDAVRMAFDALRGQRLRTGLSVLGISIGIAAVVGTVALGDAAHERLLGAFAKFAQGRIELWSDSTRLVPGTTPLGFKPTDLDVLRTLPDVLAVSPRLESNDTARAGARSAGVQIVGLRHGDLPGYQEHVVDGRELSRIEELDPVQVAMIDVRLRDRLFGETGHALGKQVLIGNLPYTVIGTVDRDSTSGFDGGIDHVFVPARTWQAKVNPSGQITNIFVRMKPDADSRALGDVIERTLLRQHGQHDFDLWNSDDSYRDASAAVGMIQLVLSVIAGISLLVGGVGVMNIMLVAVTERTPEIGIRMAVGARSSDVQLQFLSEAIVLCAVGGAAGVAVVALLAAGANLVQHELALHVSLSAVLTAIGVSSLIGVAFGFLPARQASRLSPVVALARE